MTDQPANQGQSPSGSFDRVTSAIASRRRILLISDGGRNGRHLETLLTGIEGSTYDIHHCTWTFVRSDQEVRGPFDAGVLDLDILSWPEGGLGAAVLAARARWPALPVVLVADDLGEGQGDLGETVLSRAAVTADVLAFALRYAIEAAQLRKSLTRAEAALDQGQEGIAVIDGRGIVTHANATFEAMAGIPRRDLVGRPLCVAIRARARPNLLGEMRAAQARDGAWEGRIVNEMADGRVMDLEVRLCPVPSTQETSIPGLPRPGERRGPAGRGPQQVPDSIFVARRLQHDHRDRTNELAQREADALRRSVSALAHDFNDVMARVMGHAELAGDGLERGSFRRRELDQLNQAAEGAARLVRHLFVLGSRKLVRPAGIRIDNVIDELRQGICKHVGESVELITRCSSPLWDVAIDGETLRQILTHLCDNAHNAMHMGGQLVVEVENRQADDGKTPLPPELQAAHWVLLKVSDTGSGRVGRADARDLAPFDDNGLGATTGGSLATTPEGAGLAAVYWLANSVGAHLELEAEPGRGTIVRIYFPALVPDAPDSGLAIQRMPEGSPQGWTGDETILLVDDGQALRALAARMLVRNGYTVLEANDGRDALAKAGQHAGAIDLLISDVVMPYVNGKELAGKLRRDRPEMRTLFISGYAKSTITHHGLLDPYVTFLAKPFTGRKLVTTVRSVLDEPVSGFG